MRTLVAFGLSASLMLGCATSGQQPGAARGGEPTSSHPMRQWMTAHPKWKVVAAAIAVGGLCAVVMNQTKASDQQTAAVCLAAVLAASFTVNRAIDRRLAEREALVEQVGYTDDQGYVSGVKAIELASDAVAPGSEAQISMQFWALGPSGSAPFEVTRSVGLRYSDSSNRMLAAQEIQPSPFKAGAGGLWETSFALPIPQALPEGTYEIEVLIEGPTQASTSSQTIKLIVAAG